jgi:hypothetical protein
MSLMSVERNRSNSGDRTRVGAVAEGVRPPVEIRGYATQRLLGSGAYGEVWVGVDKTTGRKVAIKYFAHRGGLDWALLSREVEKLVFLSADRYVVQLLDVGWDAEPPYYVMEYVENGSLDDHLRRKGALPVAEAVELFREVAIGLAHAHGKGVLHCDLKPANVLLDQDRRPRLADFGQSRLTDEQTPALGTLFYMAPEQADLRAIPDARWDVYALGALLYCMLTGAPPHRNSETLDKIPSGVGLAERLQWYRQHIRSAAPPDAFRRIRGIDRSLAEILDRCLAVDPNERYPHVVNVLEALDERERARVRRPFVLLGLVGPLLLLLVMGVFGSRAYLRATKESQDLAIRGAVTGNRFAAEGAAKNVAHEVDQRFRALAAAAEDPQLLERLHNVLDHPELADKWRLLVDPQAPPAERASARDALVQNPARRSLQGYLQGLLTDPRRPAAASWFVTGKDGTMLAAAFPVKPQKSPVGNNYAWRTYYHGGRRDLPTDARPDRLIADTTISPLFRSTSTGTWKVAISTPVFEQGQILGVLAMTVGLGEFVRFATSADRCALLIDARPGDHRGAILQHPLFDSILSTGRPLPPRFSKCAIDIDSLPRENGAGFVYHDPLAADTLGSAYRGDWLACTAPVTFERVTREGERQDFNTGLVLIVQQRLAAATDPVAQLGRRLYREGAAALAVVIGVTLALWYFVVQMLRGSDALRRRRSYEALEEASLHSRETLEA